jgi:hypothetical protein
LGVLVMIDGGLLAPITGPLAPYGDALKKGLETGVELICAADRHCRPVAFRRRALNPTLRLGSRRGQGTLFGPMVAALLISTGQQTLAGSSATLYLLGIGTVFVLVVLFLPGGLASIGPVLHSAVKRRWRLPSAAAPERPGSREDRRP